MASERTFLSWLHMAITIGAIAAALLAFASGTKKARADDPVHLVSKYMVEIIALTLLPLAAFIAAYALLVFTWRNSQIKLKQSAYIDDRRGPLLLVGLVATALSLILVVGLVDFYDQWQAAHSVSAVCVGSG
jgi:uncharacterized membrane protein YidH (DUF202 family)